MAKKYLDDNGLLYFWGKLKAAFLSAISYDSQNKKFTITKNGSSSDLVSASTIVADGGGAASDHGHGNIQNGGALQTNDIDIANGDKLVVTDASNDGKIARASLTFDGSTDTQALTKKGTFETFLKQHQDISGKADKVTGATNGNFAGVDSNGNPTDSGKKPSDFIEASTKGAANGVASLDSSGHVPASQLPSYVDDIIELIAISGSAPATCSAGDKYYNSTSKKIFTATETNTWGTTGETPEDGKIYVLLNDSGDYAANSQFRWGGSELVKMNDGGVSSITTEEIDIIVQS